MANYGVSRCTEPGYDLPRSSSDCLVCCSCARENNHRSSVALVPTFPSPVADPNDLIREIGHDTYSCTSIRHSSCPWQPSRGASPKPRQQPQTGTPAPAPAAPPTTWSIGAIDVSGLLDGYYSFNNNHPASGFNTLRNFEVKSNQFSLNMSKLSLSHAANPDRIHTRRRLRPRLADLSRHRPGARRQRVHPAGLRQSETGTVGWTAIRLRQVLHLRGRRTNREQSDLVLRARLSLHQRPVLSFRRASDQTANSQIYRRPAVSERVEQCGGQ